MKLLHTFALLLSLATATSGAWAQAWPGPRWQAEFGGSLRVRLSERGVGLGLP